MKKLLINSMILFVALLLSARAQADAAQAISTVGAGASLYASGAAVFNSGVAAKSEACCSPVSTPCCMMAIAAATSAASMLVSSSKSSNLSNVASCEESMGAALCNSSFTIDDVTPIDTISYDTSTGDTGLTGSDSDSSTAPSNFGSGFTFDNYGDYANKMTTANSALKSRVQGVLDSLAAKGVSVSADGQTVTLPDGSSASLSALSSSGGLSSSGFSDESIAALNSAIANAKKQNVNDQLKSLMGTAGAYAGGGSRRGANTGTRVARAAGPNMNDLLNGLMAKNKAGAKRGPTSFEGVSKSLSNGEKIGVAADNLFEMVHRKYQKKQNTFAP
ncbi:MAG: hypothetical protein CL674_01760 [Bdellovibrionaceae bacterium]|nr:hypothetical protein [Pseudobdellovibrionaceae bacterium]|tara:strand:+ start:63791 stop:64789 length:999 start_codon:yes stop_codon:yes gene_type:complete